MSELRPIVRAECWWLVVLLITAYPIGLIIMWSRRSWTRSIRLFLSLPLLGPYAAVLLTIEDGVRSPLTQCAWAYSVLSGLVVGLVVLRLVEAR